MPLTCGLLIVRNERNNDQSKAKEDFFNGVMNIFRYCPMCGKQLEGEYVAGEKFPYCPEGHYTYYPSQTVGAAAILLLDGKLLLEQRAIEPGYGRWGLPGGMAEPDEEIEECVIREFLEETGLEIEIVRLLEVRGGHKVCGIFYEAEFVGGTLKKSEESLALKAFSLDEIPFQQFAFKRHAEVVRNWLAERKESVKRVAKE
ncbi:MAG TPA: NUDIX domain-containing protein [Bacillales bacterium]|nr:NUDIX domain-containing protein [Bacillales bacterium]